MGTNNAVILTLASYATGKVGQAFNFNGNSGRVQAPSSTSLEFGSNADFCIEMWMKTGASNTFYPNVPLFEKRNGTTFWIGYSLSLNQGRLALGIGSSA